MADMTQDEEILASGGIPIPGDDASANEEAEEDDDEDDDDERRRRRTSSIVVVVAPRVAPAGIVVGRAVRRIGDSLAIPWPR